MPLQIAWPEGSLSMFCGPKRTDQLKALGDVGAKLLKLPKGPLWQVTLLARSDQAIKLQTLQSAPFDRGCAQLSLKSLSP
jgi:hypothetical protein